MLQKTPKLILLAVVILYCIENSTAQLNIKVGYAAGFLQPKNINRIIEDFNTTHPQLEDTFDPINSIHGLEIGTRYRMGSVGFELSWQNLSSKSDFIGPILTSTNFTDRWFFSVTEYSVGAETFLGNFGYGASIGYRTARMKTDITGSSRRKRTVFTESGFGTKLYLFYQLPGEKVSLTFKPYIQLPLSSIDVSNFDAEVNNQFVPSYMPVKPQNDKLVVYGISVLLYNGPQR